MKLATAWVCLIAIVLAGAPAWALWASQDPLSVASVCPVIVTGEIVGIDEAAASAPDFHVPDRTPERVLDVAHIRVAEVHRNLLIGVETRVGGEVLARMDSRKAPLRGSLDLRHDLGTKALWMLYLGDDGKFYINYRPEQKRPVGSDDKVKSQMAHLVAAGPDGGVTTQVYTIAEWIAARREKRHPMTDAEKADRARVAAFRKATVEAVNRLCEDRKLIEDRLPTLLELPRDLRSWFINRGHEELGVSKDDWVTVSLYLARNDPVENHRVRATSHLGRNFGYPRCKPFLLEMLTDRSPRMRLHACQSLMFTGDKTVAGEIEKLLADEDREVVMTAVRGLGYVGDARHLRPVMAWYRSFSGAQPPPPPAEAAVIGETLAKLGEEEVSLTLFSQGMVTDNWNVRRWAVRILEVCHSRRVVPVAMAELVPEMRRTLRNHRDHHIDDYVFIALVKVLADRTGRKHGTDVVAWLDWWKGSAGVYGADAIAFDADEVNGLQAEYDRVFTGGRRDRQ
ncbi:MAG: hypothetical protein AMK75_07065 [Planctomycetes bacterium SM23_65]|nr:MAG: hypothetical protein AMK75_07065 [Planctomycetes bacterium SM23_65]